jgi:hypothetical protein
MSADLIDDVDDGPAEKSSEDLVSLVQQIDSLVIATGLALASLTPGPAGQAGSVAAIAYDLKRKCWYGIALSATSMIPLVGYAPAFFKFGLLVYQLDGRLKTLEQNQGSFHDSPESVALLMNGLGKYYRKLPDIWVTRRLRKRLERIMGPGLSDQTALPVPSDSPSTSTSTSTQIP